MPNRYGLDDDCTALPHLHTPGVCNRCGTKLTGRRTQWCSDQCESAFRADHDWNAARHAALVRDNRRCVKCGGHGSYRTGTLRFHAGRDGWRFARLGVEWCGPDDVWIDATWHIPWLEVNHITPRNGGGYQWGCHNHLNAAVTPSLRVRAQILGESDRPDRIFVEHADRHVARAAQDASDSAGSMVVVYVRSDLGEAALADGARVPLLVEHLPVSEWADAVVESQVGGAIGALPGAVGGVFTSDASGAAHEARDRVFADLAAESRLAPLIAIQRSRAASGERLAALQARIGYCPTRGGAIAPNTEVVALAEPGAFPRCGRRTSVCAADQWQVLHTATVKQVGASEMPRQRGGLETLCHGCHVAETNRQAAARRGTAPQPTLFDEAAR